MPETVWEAFEREYLKATAPLTLGSCRIKEREGSGDGQLSPVTEIKAVVMAEGVRKDISGRGNGPIDAFSNALRTLMGMDFSLISYYEHALKRGSDSKAVAYIQIEDGQNGKSGARALIPALTPHLSRRF